MQPKRGKLSAPHFGPPASHTRTPDQSPGYYSSPSNRRRTRGHEDTNNRRRAGSIRKAEESSRKSLQAKSPENNGVGTVALFITESLKHRKTAPQNGPTGTHGPPKSGNKLLIAIRNSTRFPEGRFSGRERLPASLRGTSTENSDHNDPRAPQDIQGTLRKPWSKVPRSSRANGLRPRTTSQRSPRGKRVTQTNVKTHKEQSGTGGH
ncbi:hypothetical protein CRG98_017874 [Punica granatum]|uniref:Uncharacterized protein n=1 Tax=Punica granatum TaxID=22663 RepID=A0A2I0K0U6_PUNGR|nr:hypothetical protein CRG98_017874 [Punica granatum]